MKLLLANPNTTQAVTDRMAEVARGAASPGTEIVAVTGQVGVPYIATRAEAAIAARETMELMANHAPGCDAAIVAAFADPGPGGAKDGPLAGLAGRVKQRVAVPLVDCVAAAVRQAEALVALAPRKATEGTFRRPAAKPITGVSPALARLFGQE